MQPALPDVSLGVFLPARAVGKAAEDEGLTADRMIDRPVGLGKTLLRCTNKSGVCDLRRRVNDAPNLGNCAPNVSTAGHTSIVREAWFKTG